MHRVRLSLVFAAIFLAIQLPPQLLAREGFGFSKRAAKLNRMVPPEVYLAAGTIEVRMAENESGEATSQFRDLVEDRIHGFDERFEVDSSAPDYIVELDLVDSSFQESWETRNGTENKQTGTRQEWNAKKGRYETKPVYGDVTVYKNFKRVRGSVSARFTAIDPHRNEKIHSGSVEADYDATFENGGGAPDRLDIERHLLEKAAAQVAAKLVGSIEPVAALLPRGSFEPFVSFAEQGAWEAYFDAVESVAEKSRPGEEAYRQYALGLANEAMAYQQSDPARALEYLRTAESCYHRATQLRPDEKFFTEPYANAWTSGKPSSPIERVTSGIRTYLQLTDDRAASARN
jgi:hypothetical protein